MYFRPFIGATHVPPFILNRPDPQSPAFARDPGRIPHTLHLRNVFGGWDPRHQKPKKNGGFFTPPNMEGCCFPMVVPCISHGFRPFGKGPHNVSSGDLRSPCLFEPLILGMILQEFDLSWSRQGRTISRFRSLNEHVNEKEIRVAGFNPSEKYASQIGSFPQGSGGK